jgi:LacI family transcriptional regulator, galactose operon repressor
VSDDATSSPRGAGNSPSHTADGRGPVGSRPTMKDVAARAGVGLKTVSRVVNGEAGVTPDTAERVHAAIEALGFRRNDSARILRKGQTASIGLVLEDIGNPFYSALARAVEDVAHTNGSLLFMGSSDEDPGRERTLTLAFCARRVDGLIIVPAAKDHTYLLPETMAGIALVFVDRPAGVIEADSVLTDNIGGAREGVTHLIRQGHTRIGYIGDAPHIYTAGQRLQGYKDAMAATGLPTRPEWVAMAMPQPDVIQDALTRMLNLPEPVTGLLCGNNRISIIVLRELAARGARVATVGFDDFELAELLSPGITVVAQDPSQMGHIAADLLFRRLRGDRGPARRIELATRLVVRGSGEIPPT